MIAPFFVLGAPPSKPSKNAIIFCIANSSGMAVEIPYPFRRSAGALQVNGDCDVSRVAYRLALLRDCKSASYVCRGSCIHAFRSSCDAMLRPAVNVRKIYRAKSAETAEPLLFFRCCGLEVIPSPSAEAANLWIVCVDIAANGVYIPGQLPGGAAATSMTCFSIPDGVIWITVTDWRSLLGAPTPPTDSLKIIQGYSR